MLEGGKKRPKPLLENSKYPVYIYYASSWKFFYLDSKPNLNVLFSHVLGPKLLFTLVHKVIFSLLLKFILYRIQNIKN